MTRFAWVLRNANTGARFELTIDPIGWEELTIKLYRSPKYHGVFKEPSAKALTFLNLGGGMEFLETSFANEDINAHILLDCYHRNADTNRLSVLFTSKINFTKRIVENDSVTVNLEQSDLYQNLLSREETPVNLLSTLSIGQNTITAASTRTTTLVGMTIPLRDVYTCDQIAYSFPGIPLFNGWVYNGIQTQYNVNGDGSTIGPNITRYKPRLLTTVTGLGGIPDVSTDDFLDNDPDMDAIYTYDPIPFVTDPPITIHAKFDIIGSFTEFQGTSSGSFTAVHCHNYKCIAAYGDDWATRTEIVLKDFDTSPGDNDAWTRNNGASQFKDLGMSVAVDITLTSGQSIWFYYMREAEAFATSPSCPLIGPYPFFITSRDSYVFKSGTKIKLQVDSMREPTTCKTVLIHEAFNQIMDAIGDYDTDFTSEFYGRTDSHKKTYTVNGEGAFKAITNEKEIREISFPTTLSFKKLFDSANALDAIGLSIINEKIRIEPLAFFYQRSTQSISRPHITNFKRTTNPSRYINRISVGYERWESGIAGGLDEPCGKNEYSTKVNPVNNQLTATSSIIASSYAIELLRRQNALITGNNDTTYDNEIFWLCLNRDYSVEKFANIATAGIGMEAIATAFNLRITPARMLLAHFPIIAAGLQKIGGMISFTVKSANNNLFLSKSNIGFQNDYNGSSLSENQSFAYNDTEVAHKTPLWDNEDHEFVDALTEEEFIDLCNNPYGVCSYYQHDSDTHFGYLIEADYALLDGITKFKTLKLYGY